MSESLVYGILGHLPNAVKALLLFSHMIYLWCSSKFFNGSHAIRNTNSLIHIM